MKPITLLPVALFKHTGVFGGVWGGVVVCEGVCVRVCVVCIAPLVCAPAMKVPQLCT